MKQLSIITLFSLCCAGLPFAAEAQNPLSQSHRLMQGGKPLAGTGALNAPLKGNDGSTRHQALIHI